MDNTLKQYQNQLRIYLDGFCKDEALNYIMQLLSDEKITVPELYEEIIAPCLSSIVVSRDDEDNSIWKEHIYTNIARTIIECAYPFVLKERARYKDDILSKRVMVLCPEEEYHEIGARMGADFFTITNAEVFYIGCNTPQKNFISAYKSLKPDIVAISATNYLNLVSVKKIILEMRSEIDRNVIIVLCGSAFKHTMKSAEDFGADALVNTFREILSLRRGK